MLASQSVNQFSSFRCDFKVVDTEIKHKLIIRIRDARTTISEVLNSVKKDIPNKFGITGDCDIIHSEQGETGDPIEYSQEPAHTIFKPSDVFYIRPIIFQQSESETTEGCECPVCYHTISQRNVPYARFFQCQHTMCHNCHNRLRNRVCPMCRAPSRPEYQLDYEPDFQPDPEHDPDNMQENENEEEYIPLNDLNNEINNNLNNEINNAINNEIIYNNQYHRLRRYYLDNNGDNNILNMIH